MGFIFGVDNSSSVHTSNKKNDILVLGESPTQGLNDTKITAEAIYSIIFQDNKENLLKSSS